MEVREKIINFIKTNVTQRGLLYLAISILFLIFVTLVFKAFMISNSNGSEGVIQPTEGLYKFDLKADINRLECTFEQRRCYYNNLGLDKETILNNCNDIDYCEKGD